MSDKPQEDLPYDIEEDLIGHALSVGAGVTIQVVDLDSAAEILTKFNKRLKELERVVEGYKSHQHQSSAIEYSDSPKHLTGKPRQF